MDSNNITEILKKAFEYKNRGEFKKSIDYFYKALALDNNSSEIISELAFLYTKLANYDRAAELYEQIISKNTDETNYKIKTDYASVCEKLRDFSKAEDILSELFKAGYDLNVTAEKLFHILAENNKYDLIISLFNSGKNILQTDKIYYFVGLANLKKGDTKTAEEFFNKSFELNNSNIDSGVCLAEILINNKELEKADSILKKVLKFSENDKVFFLLGESAYLKSDLEPAVNYYSFAIKLEEKNPLYYFKLGLTFSLKGFFNEAEECFLKAISLDSQNPEYKYAIAYLYYINRKYELSEQTLNFICSEECKNPKILTLKSILLINKNEPVQADKYLTELLKSRDVSDLTYYARALYYSKLNLWSKAVIEIQKALQLKPESILYKEELANYYYNLQEFEKSGEICNQILSDNDKYIDAYILKTKIYINKKDYENALTNVNKAIKLNESSAEAYYLKGQILYLQENIKDALINYKIAVSINPKPDKHYAAIADCYYKSENYNEAYEYYKEAASINITNAQYRYYAAKCSIKNGNEQDAIANFSIMKRLNPANLYYILEYAQYMYKLGQTKSAINILESSKKYLTQKQDKDAVKKLLIEFKKNS